MIVYRRDLQKFLTITAGELITLLSDDRIDPGAELFWNAAGNIAIAEAGPSEARPGDLTRWYVGYIDLAKQQIEIQPGGRHDLDIPAAAENNPFGDSHTGLGAHAIQVEDGSDEKLNRTLMPPSEIRRA